MKRLIATIALTTLTLTLPARAHFTWIVPSADGASAQLVMSEDLKPDDEGVSIDLLSGTKLFSRDLASGKETPLALNKSGNAFAISLAGEGTRVLHGAIDLGVTQRGSAPPNHLQYYTKTIVGDPFDARATLGEKDSPIELIPHRDGDGVKFQLMFDGKPAPQDQSLRVIMPDNTQDNFKTDAAGFTETFAAPGRYGVWGRHWIDSTGTLDGKEYKQIRQYAMLVVNIGAEPTKTASAANATKTKPTSAPAEIKGDAKPFAKMVEKAASFGAVAADGWLYVYGGHTADRHNYSTASVSGKFNRLKLDDPTKWEALPEGPKVQGMNLAALDDKVYRVGGMQPRNAEGEPDDNHSIAEVACFDPKASVWQKLPDLPAGRSSHDVAFIGHQLYVVGGWTMKGKDHPSEWLKSMNVLDLDATSPEWKSIPQPFARRALIAAVHNHKLFVMGGFDEDDEPHLDVDIYDPAAGAWSKGPAIPGAAMNGFSPAACEINGKLVLSVGTGEMFQLSADEMTWTLIGHNSPRIVHRLVPFGSSVLIIGGAMNAKMTGLIELIEIDHHAASTN